MPPKGLDLSFAPCFHMHPICVKCNQFVFGPLCESETNVSMTTNTKHSSKSDLVLENKQIERCIDKILDSDALMKKNMRELQM